MTNGARWLRRSMMLLAAGLIVELVSLVGLHHPLGFMFFAAFGCTLIAAGVLVFLYAVLSAGELSRSSPPE